MREKLTVCLVCMRGGQASRAPSTVRMFSKRSPARALCTPSSMLSMNKSGGGLDHSKSRFDVFQNWYLKLVVILQIHAKSFLYLCFQGSEFVILSNKQRVRLIKVGFMFHLLLSLRLCSIPALTSRPPGKDLALMDMIIFRIT